MAKEFDEHLELFRGAATAAVAGRFGGLGVLGPVTAWQLAAACSAGRLLAPGRPPRIGGAGADTSRT